MRNNNKLTIGDYLVALIILIILIIFITMVVRVLTSPKLVYAGEHDSHCETLVSDSENCNCCDRFVAAEKEAEEKRKINNERK